MSVFVPPTSSINSDPIQALASIITTIAQQAQALADVTTLVQDPDTNPDLKPALLPLVTTIQAQMGIAAEGLTTLETAINAMGTTSS